MEKSGNGEYIRGSIEKGEVLNGVEAIDNYELGITNWGGIGREGEEMSKVLFPAAAGC